MRGRSGAGRVLIYCSTRKKTETVAKALVQAGFAAGYYHAGRSVGARDKAQRAFECGRIRILVATNAFGMGIDYPDVRLIVHFQTPGSLSAYYQEAGRAGRDGLPASCLMLFGPGDLATQRRLKSSSATSTAADLRNEKALAAMETYANEVRCRQRMLCEHFTGTADHPSCDTCDACLDPHGVHDAMNEAIETAKPPTTPLSSDALDTIVDAVSNLRRPAGKGNLAKALRGSRAKILKRGGLIELPEHGALPQYDEPSIAAAIDELLDAGRLERRGRKYPTVWSPGRPVRAERSRREAAKPRQHTRRTRRPRYSDLARELENFRRREARKLKWKSYMVFQKRVIIAIDQKRPTTLSELARIPGLGPAKVERFGDDLLDLVRRYPPPDLD